MQPVIQDATSALLRAVRAGFAVPVAFEEVRSRAWASATFAGARHQLCLRVEGDGAGAAADSFAHGLEAAEFDLRGHILADVHLVGSEQGEDADGRPLVRLRIEALTVESG